MTIWKLGLFLLKTTLTFYHVIILLYTMSQTHKGVHASLNSISGQQQQVSIMSLEMLLIYFFQNGHFWNGVYHEDEDHKIEDGDQKDEDGG